MGFLRDLGQDARNWLEPSFVTDEERAQMEQDAATDLWQGAIDDAPTVEQLMGIEHLLTPEALGMSPMPAIGMASGGWNGRVGSQEASREEQLRQARWQQEYEARRQAALRDPYLGLELLDESQLAGAGADSGAMDAQRNALREMQGIYDAGGYTDVERAQMQGAQRDAANFERSQRLAAQENARARGMGGGGMELMGALAAQQGGANRANDWANQITVAGQQRALQALQNSGEMAGQMRNQSFNEDVTRRQAADAFHMANVGLMNDWTQQRGNAYQQAYNNQLQGTAGATGQYNANAATHAANAAASQAQTQGILQAGITAIASAYGGPAAGAAANGAMNSTKTAGATGGAKINGAPRPNDDEERQGVSPYSAPRRGY